MPARAAAEHPRARKKRVLSAWSATVGRILRVDHEVAFVDRDALRSLSWSSYRPDQMGRAP